MLPLNVGNSRLNAALVLDAGGLPISHKEGDTDHYEIKLWVDDTPEDTHAVTYQLHASYYDPVREVRKRTGGFPALITSYGDYTVRATVRGKRGNEFLQTDLIAALARTHSEDTSPAVMKALESIRAK